MIYKNLPWRQYHGALIPQSAPHVSIHLTKEEEEELLIQSGAFFLRYVSDWDMPHETEFWYIIKDNFGGLDELSANTRSKVRRGLKHCQVKKVSAQTISQQGYEVYLKAFETYRTYTHPMSKEAFISDILAKDDSEFWGVYARENNLLIAYSQNFLEDKSVNYSTIKFHPDYLRLYPSYALFFEMNRHYLDERAFLYVNDGARSIAHETNIQSYLIEKFKFKKAYCRLHVRYRRDIGFIIKWLYPFRKWISKIGIRSFQKLYIVLKQEEIRRSFE